MSIALNVQFTKHLILMVAHKPVLLPEIPITSIPYILILHLHLHIFFVLLNLIIRFIDLLNLSANIKTFHWFLGLTLNQLLFAMTLFCNLPDINWFAATYINDQALSTPILLNGLHPYGKDFATKNFSQNLRRFLARK